MRQAFRVADLEVVRRFLASLVNEDQTKPSRSRALTAIVLCPGVIYFVTLALSHSIDLVRGRPAHLFTPRYFFPLTMLHQWSPATIFSFYVVCCILALPLIRVIRRQSPRSLLICVAGVWSFVSFVYFLLFDLPFWGVLDWQQSFCGALAGGAGGLLYFFIVYAQRTGIA